MCSTSPDCRSKMLLSRGFSATDSSAGSIAAYVAIACPILMYTPPLVSMTCAMRGAVNSQNLRCAARYSSCSGLNASSPACEKKV